MTARSEGDGRAGQAATAHPPATLALALIEALAQPVLLYDADDRLVLANAAARDLGDVGGESTELQLSDPGGAPLGRAMLLGVGQRDGDGDRLRQYASDIETLTEVGNMLSELQDPEEAAAMICTVTTGRSSMRPPTPPCTKPSAAGATVP